MNIEKFAPTTCQICGKARSAASHAKCSQIKKMRFAAEAANTKAKEESK